ncbi:class III lanthipeptide [Chengkuizengella sp. SCS-71B]|uniref:class III lanthipeptide n=1 Tax=Chengkuizengella sp. SCS-71B TaxID=3115290 RepID=UPI0032C247E9
MNQVLVLQQLEVKKDKNKSMMSSDSNTVTLPLVKGKIELFYRMRDNTKSKK